MKIVAYTEPGVFASISMSSAFAIAARSWPSASRVRSDAWMFAMSSAAPTPLPDTSPTSSAIWPSATSK